MLKALSGKKIVLAASRKTEEMSTLIEKQGGTAIVHPLQGTVFLADEQIVPEIETFLEEGCDWIVLTTGIGTETLLDISKKLNQEERFISILQNAKVASRGYKTFRVLKNLNIKPDAKDEDGTTRGLIHALKDEDFSGKRVVLQLHGETAPRLTSFLENQGASVFHLLPYQHTPPKLEVVEAFCKDLLQNEIDAVCFTTAIQVRSLFHYAKQKGILNDILAVFQDRVIGVAVGKVTAEAMKEEGISRIISPTLERMGAMIVELAEYYKKMERE